jgi:hypothetical protein
VIAPDMTAIRVAALPVGITAHLSGVNVSHRGVAEWRFASRQRTVTLSRDNHAWRVGDSRTVSTGLFDAIKLAFEAV